MTYEKAIEWMIVEKHCIIECPDEVNDASKEIIEAYNMAIEALEKQIPQKVDFGIDRAGERRKNNQFVLYAITLSHKPTSLVKVRK